MPGANVRRGGVGSREPRLMLGYLSLGFAGGGTLTPALSQRERERVGLALSQRERERVGLALSQRKRERVGLALSQRVQ